MGFPPQCAQGKARAGGDSVPGAVAPARVTWQGQGRAPMAAGLWLLSLCLSGRVWAAEAVPLQTQEMLVPISHPALGGTDVTYLLDV